jgi:DNA-binding response OmpR family regulator
MNWKEHIQAVERTIEELLERERLRNQPARLLVVDDEPNDVLLLCRVLEGFNCEVQICRDPVEAKAILDAGKFDFVLLDQKMPKISGIEILRQTLPASTVRQFFIVSGFLDSQLVSDSLKLGALFLPKPVKPESLFFLKRKPHD